jgi:hypothetical protein
MSRDFIECREWNALKAIPSHISIQGVSVLGFLQRIGEKDRLSSTIVDIRHSHSVAHGEQPLGDGLNAWINGFKHVAELGMNAGLRFGNLDQLEARADGAELRMNDKSVESESGCADQTKDEGPCGLTPSHQPNSQVRPTFAQQSSCVQPSPATQAQKEQGVKERREREHQMVDEVKKDDTKGPPNLRPRAVGRCLRVGDHVKREEEERRRRQRAIKKRLRRHMPAHNPGA